MRKEIYKVKCPQHIVFGDPMYFERFRGNELNRLTVDYRPSKYFDTARLVLKEEPNRELSEYMNRSITLYAAPRQTIDVYACEQIYTFQKISAKNTQPPDRTCAKNASKHRQYPARKNAE